MVFPMLKTGLYITCLFWLLLCLLSLLLQLFFALSRPRTNVDLTWPASLVLVSSFFLVSPVCSFILAVLVTAEKRHKVADPMNPDSDSSSDV